MLDLCTPASAAVVSDLVSEIPDATVLISFCRFFASLPLVFVVTVLSSEYAAGTGPPGTECSLSDGATSGAAKAGDGKRGCGCGLGRGRWRWAMAWAVFRVGLHLNSVLAFESVSVIVPVDFVGLHLEFVLVLDKGIGSRFA